MCCLYKGKRKRNTPEKIMFVVIVFATTLFVLNRCSRDDEDDTVVVWDKYSASFVIIDKE